MAKNKMEDLRDHLFATLESLRDEEKPMELDRAGKIAEVAKVLIETAKVEVEMMKVTGAAQGSGFIPEGKIDAPRPPARLLAGSPKS